MSLLDQTNLKADTCHLELSIKQSQGPGLYQLERPGMVACRTSEQYSDLIGSVPFNMHDYRDPCYIDAETGLWRPELTDHRNIHQLHPRPYLGHSKAPGTGTLEHKDIESRLLHGEGEPCFKSCERTAGIVIDRFQHLPKYGNPQLVSRVIPKWKRGGVATRDEHRHVDFDKCCSKLKKQQRKRKQRTQRK